MECSHPPCTCNVEAEGDTCDPECGVALDPDVCSCAHPGCEGHADE